MLLALLGAVEDSLHEDGTILDDFKKLFTSLLSQNSVCDKLKLGLVGVCATIYLHSASAIAVVLR